MRILFQYYSKLEVKSAYNNHNQVNPRNQVILTFNLFDYIFMNFFIYCY